MQVLLNGVISKLNCLTLIEMGDFCVGVSFTFFVASDPFPWFLTENESRTWDQAAFAFFSRLSNFRINVSDTDSLCCV